MAYSSLLLLGLCDNIRGPLFPEILRDFSVSDIKGSLFFTLSSLCGIFGGYFSRHLISKYSLLGSLQISFVFLLIGQLIISQAVRFEYLLMGVLFFGFSLGLMGVVQNMLVVQEIPDGPLKKKVISGLHSMYAGSSLVAPILVGMVAQFDSPLGLWRTTFFIGAALCLLIFLLSFLVKGLEKQATHSVEDLPPNMHSKGKTKWMQIYFAVILSCYVLAEILVSSRVALFVRREMNGSLADSNFYTGAFFVGLFCSRLLFALWSPKVSVEFQLKASLILTGLCLLVGLLVHPMGFAISGFFMGPFYPLMMLELGKLFRHSVKDAISWAVTICSVFVVFMHFFVGFVSENYGVKTAFFLGPVFILISLVMFINYEKVFRRL